MPIALTPEHEDLAGAVRRWAGTHCPPSVPRAAMEASPGALPAVWKELAAQGWLALHLPEVHGGEGFGLVEAAVVLEELGRALVPGPLLPTVVASALVARHGDATQQAALLPGLADGSATAGIHLGAGGPVGAEAPDGGLRLDGAARPVLGAPQASVLVVWADPGGWCVVERGPGAPGVTVNALAALDPTRPLGEVRFHEVVVPAGRRLRGATRDEGLELAAALAAAEASGGSAWCVDTAAAHAIDRVQFGRPIGQFQAVKHKVADMLVAREQLAAVAWDAARAADAPRAAGAHDAAAERALAASAAAVLAGERFAGCAKDCVQVLGGIGFTWEHDAHLYLKRALAARQLFGSADDHRRRLAELALGGARRPLGVDLPPQAEAIRPGVAAQARQAAELDGDGLRRFLVDEGLLVPHWPRPWGRDASPVEQLVIDEELAAAGVTRPGLGVGAWALPTLVAHGTPAQQERWVRPTLLGQLAWCQLFSEPGAGSDLASLTTRAERDGGGWRLTGQKVWTSMAQSAQWGICLARTDPDVVRHQGITYFVVDMSAPGVDIRPLRELTGETMFNEVFFDSVLVPGDCVVGRPGDGWRIARTTLDNERVSISSGSTFGIGVESVLRRLGRLGARAPIGADLLLGELLAESQSLRLLSLQATLRSLSELEPGAGASVRKLVGAEHEQRVQEAGLALYGADGAVAEGSTGRWVQGVLATRCLTIAGGTSEIQRNVIAERLLGLPRDPEPGT